MVGWASHERTIQAMILVGSRSQRKGEAPCADEWSDWDFQIVTSKLDTFERDEWTRAAGLSRPLIYVKRRGRLGHTDKISAVFKDGDLDLVLIPARQLLLLKWLTIAGLASHIPAARRPLKDLSTVLRQGYHFVKSSPRFETFF